MIDLTVILNVCLLVFPGASNNDYKYFDIWLQKIYIGTLSQWVNYQIADFMSCTSILRNMAKKVPKVFVFDLDGCCWDPEMYELWGGGAPFKENKDGSLSDKNGTRVQLLGDVKNILHELKTDPKWSDSIVAVASTCDEPRWAKECIR